MNQEGIRSERFFQINQIIIHLISVIKNMELQSPSQILPLSLRFVWKKTMNQASMNSLPVIFVMVDLQAKEASSEPLSTNLTSNTGQNKTIYP